MYGVRLIAPLLGPNDPLDAQLVAKTIPNTTTVAHHHRHFILAGQQGHGPHRGSLSAEKVHKNALSAGILIGQDPQEAVLFQHFLRRFDGPFLEDQLQAALWS